jgi:alpha-ribazole phosphatase
MNILLIRHTQPAVAQGICYGQTDLQLADTFLEELETLKAKLPFIPETVYTSPLQRCKLLSDNLFDAKTIVSDVRLMEMNFGEWEMQAWNDLNQEELKKWSDNFVETPTPQGESFIKLQERVQFFWKEFLHKHHDNKNNEEGQKSENIAIVTHAGVMRVLGCEVLGLPLQNAFRMDISYGKTVLISGKNPYWAIKYWNF